MSCREYAMYYGFPVVGKLKRMPDRYYGVQNGHYRWYMDEAGNEYLMDNPYGKWICSCIVTWDGRVI